MQRETFEQFSNLVYRESGIVLPPEKLPLLSSRIQKRLKELNLKKESEYLKIIELDLSGAELTKLIDAISTNVTYFYREEGHFQIYKSILLEFKKQKKSPVKIWCAAASSGEEPYTLAFEAAESLDLKVEKVKILATDICTQVLEKAIEGIYSENVTSKIPVKIRNSYMQPFEKNSQKLWQVKSEIKSLLLFKKLNLISFPYPLSGPMDIIFCRNVMIYFDKKTREKIVQQLEKLLAPGGYLFLSHSENLMGIDCNLKKAGPSVFKKVS